MHFSSFPSLTYFSISLLLFFLHYQILFSPLLTSHACPLSRLSVVRQSSEATQADEGMITCLFPSPSALPSQLAGCQCVEEIEMR